MDLLSIIVSVATPFTIALFALLIVREGQKDRAAENARRDKLEQDRQDRQQKSDQQFMILFGTITGRQVETKTAIETAEKNVGEKVEGARDDIVEGLREYRKFNVIILDMLLEDPPAGRTRIKRAMTAFAEGDVKKAQAVADETPAAADTDEPVNEEGKAAA